MTATKPVGRPIGKQIPTILECLEKIGPSTSKQLAEAVGMDARSVSKLLKRCEFRELTRVDDSDDLRVHRVALAWRDRLEARDWRPTPKAAEMPPKFKTPAVNSVFAMST